ncbi:MAG: hypothetical protein WCG25_04530 [bacterium]
MGDHKVLVVEFIRCKSIAFIVQSFSALTSFLNFHNSSSSDFILGFFHH